MFEILDNIQIGANGVDLRLSVTSERGSVLVCLRDYSDEQSRCGVSALEEARFLEMSMSDFEAYVYSVYWFSMVEE